MPFFHGDELVGFYVAQHLSGAAGGPGHGDFVNHGSLTDTDFAAQGRAAETAAGVDFPIHHALHAVFVELDFDLRPDGGAVGFCAFQIQTNPVVGVLPRIEVKRRVVGIAAIRAAHVHVDVLVAVVVEVGEGDGVAFLQVPDPC